MCKPLKLFRQLKGGHFKDFKFKKFSYVLSQVLLTIGIQKLFWSLYFVLFLFFKYHESSVRELLGHPERNAVKNLLQNTFVIYILQGKPKLAAPPFPF